MKRRIQQMINIKEKENSTELPQLPICNPLYYEEDLSKTKNKQNGQEPNPSIKHVSGAEREQTDSLSSKADILQADDDQIGQKAETSTGYTIEITDGDTTSSITHQDSLNIPIKKIITLVDSDGSSEDTPNTERYEMKNLTNHEQMPANLDPVKSEKSDQITEILIEKMNEILSDAKNEQDKMTSESSVGCGIWDFAGQKDYYATHQTFFTQHAIYLLVADIEEGIEDSKHDNHFDSIGSKI